jgi:hypothetical protein
VVRQHYSGVGNRIVSNNRRYCYSKSNNNDNLYGYGFTDGKVVPTPATATVTVNGAPAISISPPSAAFCNGNVVTLTASCSANCGASPTYTWSPATDLSITTGPVVNAYPSVTTTYTVTVTGANGCTNTANVTITVTPTPTVIFHLIHPFALVVTAELGSIKLYRHNRKMGILNRRWSYMDKYQQYQCYVFVFKFEYNNYLQGFAYPE